MCFPYEYSYFVFDFCLIKKMCVRKQKREWAVEGESKGTGERETVREREREGGTRGKAEWEGSGRDQQSGWRVRMSDETNRAVQAPTHAATAVIYGADASSMENRASRRRGDLRRSASLTDRSALLKGHSTNKAAAPPATMSNGTGHWWQARC